MGIKFQCHECQHKLNVKEFLAGKRGTCPKCGLKFRIPQSDQEFSIALQPKQAKAEVSQSVADPEPAAQTAAVTTTAVESESPVVEQTADGEGPSSNSLSPLDTGEGVLWYVRPPSGGQYGPAESDLLLQWIGESRVVPGSLVWRDGWPQWRLAEEVFEDQFANAAAASIDVEAELPSPAGAGDPLDNLSSTKPTKQADPEIGARLRSKREKRTKMIALLTGVSLLLVGTLIVVIWLTSGSAEATP